MPGRGARSGLPKLGSFKSARDQTASFEMKSLIACGLLPTRLPLLSFRIPNCISLRKYAASPAVIAAAIVLSAYLEPNVHRLLTYNPKCRQMVYIWGSERLDSTGTCRPELPVLELQVRKNAVSCSDNHAGRPAFAH